MALWIIVAIGSYMSHSKILCIVAIALAVMAATDIAVLSKKHKTNKTATTIVVLEIHEDHVIIQRPPDDMAPLYLMIKSERYKLYAEKEDSLLYKKIQTERAENEQ